VIVLRDETITQVILTFIALFFQYLMWSIVYGGGKLFPITWYSVGIGFTIAFFAAMSIFAVVVIIIEQLRKPENI